MTITDIRPAGDGEATVGAPRDTAPVTAAPVTMGSDGTASAVWDALTAHPGATVAVIAEAAGVSRGAVSRALTALEAAGQVVRTPGAGSGRGKTGGTWQAVPVREEAGTDEPPSVPGTAPASGGEAAGTGPVLDLQGAVEILVGEQERRAQAEADMTRVQAEEAERRAEIDERLRRARTKEDTRCALADLLAMVTTTYAAVIADDDEAAVAAGLEQITAQAGTARRAAKAPGAARTGAAGTGAGAGAGERSEPRPLRPLVEAHLTAHPGKEFTPTEIARVLGRSSGAVANALDRLTEKGIAELTCEKPRRFRATTTATATTATATADGRDAVTADRDGTDAAAGR